MLRFIPPSPSRPWATYIPPMHVKTNTYFLDGPFTLYCTETVFFPHMKSWLLSLMYTWHKGKAHVNLSLFVLINKTHRKGFAKYMAYYYYYYYYDFTAHIYNYKEDDHELQDDSYNTSQKVVLKVRRYTPAAYDT